MSPSKSNSGTAPTEIPARQTLSDASRSHSTDHTSPTIVFSVWPFQNPDGDLVLSGGGTNWDTSTPWALVTLCRRLTEDLSETKNQLETDLRASADRESLLRQFGTSLAISARFHGLTQQRIWVHSPLLPTDVQITELTKSELTVQDSISHNTLFIHPYIHLTMLESHHEGDGVVTMVHLGCVVESNLEFQEREGSAKLISDILDSIHPKMASPPPFRPPAYYLSTASDGANPITSVDFYQSLAEALTESKAKHLILLGTNEMSCPKDPLRHSETSSHSGTGLTGPSGEGKSTTGSNEEEVRLKISSSMGTVATTEWHNSMMTKLLGTHENTEPGVASSHVAPMPARRAEELLRRMFSETYPVSQNASEYGSESDDF